MPSDVKRMLSHGKHTSETDSAFSVSVNQYSSGIDPNEMHTSASYHTRKSLQSTSNYELMTRSPNLFASQISS